MKILTKIILILLIVNCTLQITNAQNIAITDDDIYSPESSAMLDVKSTTKGLLIPRLTTIQRNDILSPASGLLVYDTSIEAFYYYNGTLWIDLTSGSASGSYWSYNSPNIYMTNSTDNLGIGTSSPQHKLHLFKNVSTTDGTDGNFIDIQNNNGGTGVMSGIRFTNGYYGTPDYFKGGIFYKDVRGYNRGDLILANNSAITGNVSASDARLVIQNDGHVMVKGDPNSSLEDVIFAVQNSNGDTIFAVYPEGVRINVYDDTLTRASSTKGGFAVGGFSPSRSTETNEYLRITPDSIRMYIEEGNINRASSSKGGFAVGGFSPTRGTATDYFNIYGSTTVTTIDSEARIFWYPLKEAFMTGRVLVESPDSVGTNSFASGFESKAIGNYSQALGYKARAKGNNSIAIGNNASAEGQESYALGNFALTSDEGSYAIGSGAKASGLRSFALGSTGVDSAGVTTSATIASGDYSYAFGMGSTSSGKGAFSFGTQNVASGDYSLSIGYENISSTYGSMCFGNNNNSSGLLGYGISIGAGNTASGFIGSGIAIGIDNEVKGSYVVAAIGYKNYIYGINSYVIGSRGSVGNEDTPVSNSILFNLDYDIPTTLMSNNVFSIMHGKLGVGLTNPSQLLDIYGSSPNIEITNTSETEAGVIFNDAQATGSQYSKILYSSSNNRLSFYNASTTAKMTISTVGIAIGGGTTIKKVQHGTYTVGTNTTGGIKTVTITFPNSFSGTPKVNVTVKGGNYTDVFAITTRNVGTSSFQVNIYRVDNPGYGWWQSLYLDWFAWE